MVTLSADQAKYLRGLAHSRKPVVTIGQNGLTGAVIRSIDAALKRHELIKIKFVAHKEKDRKKEMIAEIVERTNSERVGLIGHTAIFYRRQKDPRKRKIVLPAQRKPDA